MSKTIDDTRDLETRLRQDLGLLDWQIRDILPVVGNLLLGEDAPEDRIGIQLYQDNKDSEEYWSCKECEGYDECDCSGFNDSNTAWRQHIRNKLGSKGQDGE